MFRMIGVAGVSLTGALVLTLPTAALAQPGTAADEVVVSSDGPRETALPVDEVVFADVRLDPVGPDPGDEIVVACLRLPTLADLSKERWNETHRRFDGRRGRPLREA